MSRITPDPLVGQFTAGVVEVYRALKAIPNHDITVWVRLPLPGSDDRPDFLIVTGHSAAFLLSVCEDGQSDVEEASGLSLFSGPRSRRMPGRREAELLDRFLEPLSQHPSIAGSVEGIHRVIVFPHVPDETIDAIPPEFRPATIRYLGRGYLQPDTLSRILLDSLNQPCSEECLAALRAAFTPESVVPERFSATRTIDRMLDAQLTPMLLDFDQEHWAKQKLVLSDDALHVVEDAGNYASAALVTGVAGSGKSLVLLFRACTQARLAPDTRTLLLTHNKALKAELECRFAELGQPRNVRCFTFFSWIRNLVGRHQNISDIVQYGERDAVVAAAAQKIWGNLVPAQVEFLRDEFDWMQDRGVVTGDAYLKAERSGRVVPLGPIARQKVFETFQSYRAALRESGREDWSGFALRAWELVQRGELPINQYDFIYVDEAQFFAPVWFQLIRHALRPGTGRILLAADPTQGFLKRRQSWIGCGLDLRGKATKLRRSYRSSRQILEFAALFYRARMDDDELPDLNLAGREELESAVHGEPPEWLRLKSRQDEVSRTINEIRQYLDEGGAPDHVLVLVAGELRFHTTLDSLMRAFGPERVRDARVANPPAAIRVCGINAATGLESPIVFLIGIADLIDQEQDFSLKAEIRQERIRDNTRRLYMAFTRAGRKLVITWTRPEFPSWLID